MEAIASLLAPWLALAGLGALHGLNPACGWLQAAACGLQQGDRRHVLHALWPIALGHALSVALVAAAVATAVLTGLAAEPATGPAMDGRWLQWPAGLLLVMVAGLQLRRDRCAGGAGGPRRIAGDGGHRHRQAAMALCAFIISSAQGAGLMLVPALVPLCLSGSPAREITASGSLLLAFAAVALHMGAMLLVTALVASAACRGVQAAVRWQRWTMGQPSDR